MRRAMIMTAEEITPLKVALNNTELAALLPEYGKRCIYVSKDKDTEQDEYFFCVNTNYQVKRAGGPNLGDIDMLVIVPSDSEAMQALTIKIATAQQTKQ